MFQYSEVCLKAVFSAPFFYYLLENSYAEGVFLKADFTHRAKINSA